MTVLTAPFGVTADGTPVNLHTLTNAAGMQAEILDYGCVIRALRVPDRTGTLTDVVLGYDTLAEYESRTCFFGTFVGRYANRIKGASFSLDGVTYHMPANEGENHLHGTYCSRVYPGVVEGNALVFRCVSPAGEEGFPGTLTFSVSYTLTEDNALVIDYAAETDAPTVLNFTNHSYFNLNGQDGSQIFSHSLKIHADAITECGPGCIPTGAYLPVVGTPFDFNEAKTIGRDFYAELPQLRSTGGYDHNFVLRGELGTLHPAAEASSEVTGIALQCETTEPGMQLYTGNFITGDSAVGKAGVVYPRHGAFCLETQHFPCSPNFPQFPTTTLRPGEHYSSRTLYRFTTI